MKINYVHAKHWLMNNQKKIYYWIASGFAMLFVSTAILYLFVDILKIKLLLATFLTAECALIIRFVINQRIIFKSSSENLTKQFLQFHIASASAFFVWWSATNLLAFNDIHYLVASLVAVGFSTGVNFFTNFFWVWKNETKSS